MIMQMDQKDNQESKSLLKAKNLIGFFWLVSEEFLNNPLNTEICPAWLFNRSTVRRVILVSKQTTVGVPQRVF